MSKLIFERSPFIDSLNKRQKRKLAEAIGKALAEMDGTHIWMPEREIPWGERGPVRYALMSYGLWLRHIWFDMIGRKPRKKGKR